MWIILLYSMSTALVFISDRWSFGVLLWEISTRGMLIVTTGLRHYVIYLLHTHPGQLPYPGKTLEEILQGLKECQVLEKHDECPADL